MVSSKLAFWSRMDFPLYFNRHFFCKSIYYGLEKRDCFSCRFTFYSLQFGLKNNLLAAIDILLVLGTLIWLMVAIYPHAKWIAYIQIPYLLWVSFATVLQLTITYLNR